jgi:hypothetical protein
LDHQEWHREKLEKESLKRLEKKSKQRLKGQSEGHRSRYGHDDWNSDDDHDHDRKVGKRSSRKIRTPRSNDLRPIPGTKNMRLNIIIKIKLYYIGL